MRAGRLDRRITIESHTQAQDAYGGVTDSWATLVTNLPAEVLAQSGSEPFQSEQHVYRTFKKFRIRWRTDVKIRDRVKYTRDRTGSDVTEIYNIVDIIELGRREGLMLVAEAEVSD